MAYLAPATEPPSGTGCRAGAHIAAGRPGSDLFRGRREHPATRVVIGDSGRSWAFRLALHTREVAGSKPAAPILQWCCESAVRGNIDRGLQTPRSGRWPNASVSGRATTATCPSATSADDRALAA